MASKNTSKNASKNTAKGLWAEQVVRQYLEKKSHQLMAQRYQIQGIEIDLVFKKDHDWLLVEVKFLDNIWRAGERVSQKQIQRLKKIESYLKFNKKIKQILFLIALVEENKTIHWINLTDY